MMLLRLTVVLARKAEALKIFGLSGCWVEACLL